MPDDLKLKYRPQALEEFYGNQFLVEGIRTYIDNENKSHAVLLHGPKGCGKTTMGRIIARMLGSALNPPNFLEFDLASDGGVDSAKKKIVQTARFKPIIREGEKPVKIYLLDEAHMLTKQGASALLKTIEEPPPFVYFIFATTDPQRVLDTILSRCVKFEVFSLQDSEMESLISDVCELENFSVSKRVLRKIVQVAKGCPRDSLVCLSQVKGMTEESAMGLLSSGILEDESNRIAGILFNSKIQNKWEELRPILSELKDDSKAEKMRIGILKYIEAVVLNPKTPGRTLKYADSLSLYFLQPFDRIGKTGLTLALLGATGVVE